MSRHSALFHDSGVRRCVDNKAGCARDRALCHALQRRELDRGILSRYRFSVAINLYRSQKKKKKEIPENWGVTIGVPFPLNNPKVVYYSFNHLNIYKKLIHPYIVLTYRIKESLKELISLAQ